MLPDRVSNPGPLTYESSALPIALRGQAHFYRSCLILRESANYMSCQSHSPFGLRNVRNGFYEGLYRGKAQLLHGQGFPNHLCIFI